LFSTELTLKAVPIAIPNTATRAILTDGTDTTVIAVIIITILQISMKEE